MTYEQLEASIIAWAETQPDIRAVIAIGSRARGNADRWSDLDLLIFTSNPQSYAASPDWLRAFGETWVTYMEPTAAGDPEWYVVFEGGIKLDAVPMQVEDASLDLDTLLKPFAHWHALQRGADVWFDRLGSRRPLPRVAFAPPPPPSADIFANDINGFLLAATTSAKFIARGDYWRAQRWFANDLHVHLLRLTEWHAYGRDTWYSGRFMDQWADPRVLAALPHVFPSYERDSLERALLAVLALVRWLGAETAVKLGYPFPTDAYEKIAALVQAFLGEA